LQKVVLDEEISFDNYIEIQRFYFYKKKHRLWWIILLSVLCILISGVNILATRRVSVGAVFFLLLPIFSIIATELNIIRVCKSMFAQDAKKWHIEVEKDCVRAKMEGMTQTLKIHFSLWRIAYELDSVILLYFGDFQYITIVKDAVSPEELVFIKGVLYDKLFGNFKLKVKK